MVYFLRFEKPSPQFRVRRSEGVENGVWEGGNKKFSFALILVLVFDRRKTLHNPCETVLAIV